MQYSRLVLICLIGTSLIGPIALAEDAPGKKSQKFLVRVETVKPDMVTEYEDLVKNELIPALKKGGISAQETWTTAALGEFYHYVYIHPIADFSLFDSASPTEKALGSESAQRLTAKLRRCLSSVEYHVMTERPDLSRSSEDKSEPKLALIAHYQVAPGKTSEFEKLLKEEVLAAREPTAEKKPEEQSEEDASEEKKPAVSAYQIVLGGNPNTLVVVFPLESFASLDAENAPQPAKLGEKAANLVHHVDTSVYRYVSALSFK